MKVWVPMQIERPAESFDCSSLPAWALQESVRQFNAGEYFACHETLEELWLMEKGKLRRLYQGILQVAVGLYHLQRGNERGSLLLLARGAELLRPFAPSCLEIDVAALVSGAEAVLTSLKTLGLTETQALAAELFPQIRWVSEEERMAR